MQQSLFTQLFLPIALGIIMLGLGLSLTIADFRRVAKYPKAIVVALLCQMALLPAICFLLVKSTGLDPSLAAGMMLLAASPGGATSNLFTHLYKGDVALNISLTALNSILSLFILPIIVNFTLDYFMDSGQYIPMQFKKVAEVFAIAIIPVTIGMVINKIKPAFAARIYQSVKIVSALILLIIVVVIGVKEKDVLTRNFGGIGLPLLLFNVLSVVIGYLVPRLFRIEVKQALSISMVIGIHNGTLAIYIALNVLYNPTMAIPSAIYSLLMFFTAAVFGFLINKINPKNRSLPL